MEGSQGRYAEGDDVALGQGANHLSPAAQPWLQPLAQTPNGKSTSEPEGRQMVRKRSTGHRRPHRLEMSEPEGLSIKLFVDPRFILNGEEMQIS